MDSYLGVAKEEGISEEEIAAVQAIVMAVSGGRVMAQFREIRHRARRQPGGCRPAGETNHDK